MKHLPLLLTLAVGVAAPLSASAQDIEDLDSDGARKPKKQKNKDREVVVASDEIVREIERGWYVKANAGMAAYLGRFANPVLRPGSIVNLAVGNDFVDEPNRSMSWELTAYQGVHNGMAWDFQNDNGVAPTNHIQGDTRTFAAMASYEFSTYPSRRVGIGVRAGAGIMITPLLLERGLYDTEVTREWGNRPTVHSQPHFPVFAGPTLEYYTKLSHFSVGIDADFMFVVGFDFGINATGFMKYTF